jgi:ABC-type sugar transport system substrate-binding protein
MSLPSRTARGLATPLAFLAAGALLVGCTSNEPAASGSESGTQARAASSNDDTGDTVTIGFSGPAADHGWLAAINSAAQEEAENYDDVELRVAEGTNDANLQISQIETFINDKVDAIVMLPTDGAALTDVAIRAMEAGIPVVNVDREFSSPFAARTTILGDNYGMGVSAGTYACELVESRNLTDPVIAEIAGIDALPLTQDRSKLRRRAEGLRPGGRQPGRRRVHRRVG